MSLKNFTLTPPTMTALQGMIFERLKNVAILKEAGTGTTEVQCLIAEICVVEAKLDAFMRMCESKEADFSTLGKYIELAANDLKQNAINVRTQIMAGLKK